MLSAALLTAALGATVAPRESALTEFSTAAPTLCGASCPWDTAALPVTCTDPKLRVAFGKVVHYSGIVECGNLFLDVDLGSALQYQADRAPWVHFATADPKKLYTVIMFDPDANMNGSWPVVPAGNLGPIRHWVVGNIAGKDVADGFDGGRDFKSGATIVTPFAAPAPPIGSHRYGIFLFEQADTTPIKFATLNNQIGQKGTERFNWDITSFVSTYNLGTPVASNWFIAMHSPDGYTAYP